MTKPRKARLATSILFLVHGLLVSSWVSRIPQVQESLRLSEGVLGMALLGIALGSLVAMPVTGALITRLGSRSLCVVTTFLFCMAVAAIPLAGGALSLSLALASYGAAAGAMDVAMNAQGVTVEGLYRRSVMSSFHALFSIGGMIGAFSGGMLARWGITVDLHLAGAALLGAVMTVIAWPWLAGNNLEPRVESGPAFSLPRGPLVTLGALGFCILLCEGAIADWIAIFLRDALQAGPAVAAGGYAVFSGAMSIGRLAGDWATDRAGPVRIVRFGAAIAATGLGGALLSGNAPGALLALVAVGLGYAAIVPNVFAASARIPGVASGNGIAAVTTMGYFGFLVGPPMIGWLAEWLGLRNALFVLVILSAAAAMLAGAVRTAHPHEAVVYEPDPHG